ncbi:bifunctional AP-4-A phosphorylase/ADP sulfurylase [Onygenales sp. PD_12]|nr:bifunctional AP-4-A phosphorylase/ADP sulfurylase [Onygenales sp. PD_12]
MPLSNLTENLPALVATRFRAARQSGALVFSHTEVTTLEAVGIPPFQLRYCPALAKKPTTTSDNDDGDGGDNSNAADNATTTTTTTTPIVKKQKPDPFENPTGDLVIGKITSPSSPSSPPSSSSASPHETHTHTLVLNKFPVIPNHFILATTLFKPQTDLLERDDLMVTFQCLKAWEGGRQRRRDDGDGDEDEDGDDGAVDGDGGGGAGAGGRRLFAFFNSGEHSGASQPHRHLQFLPVEWMGRGEGEGEGEGDGWRPLIYRDGDGDGDGHDETRVGVSDGDGGDWCQPRPFNVPFACYAVDLPAAPAPAPSAEELHRAYLNLYRRAVRAVERFTNTRLSSSGGGGGGGGGGDDEYQGPAAKISYNLAMTTGRMLICPRRREAAEIPIEPGAKREFVDAGLVSLNGTVLAGTLMVKTLREWEVLRSRPGVLGGILGTVGFPPDLDRGRDV